MHSERARQWVHIGSGLFALLLRVLTWWQAAALAATALVFNLYALPRVGGRRLYRPVDELRGFPVGIILYPLAVLLLILMFPARPDIAAAAWGILAAGDGAATLVGRAVSNFAPAPSSKQPALASAMPRGEPMTSARTPASGAPPRRSILGRRWPWNRDKTVGGTAGFILFGGAAGVALAWWTRDAVVPHPPIAFAITAPLVAALAAAFVETIAVRLDDNVSVPATAAVVLWIASLVDHVAVSAALPAVVDRVPSAIAVNVLASWLGYRARSVSRAGAVGGALIGTIIYAGGGGAAWVLLFATFLVASATSRLGMERKVLLGIAEERAGRRGAGNAIANCGVAVIAAVAAVVTPYRPAAMLALVAALTAGGSDTVASEIGKAWGRSTYLVISLGRVKPGTPGAMSLEGTAAGLVAAFALAALGVALGLAPAAALVAIVVGATAGALAESALAATLEAPGILNNDMLNFVNTAVAAAVALVLL
jgi:uncharacterized protein (TIGR00297 family)